jgi:flagellar protein FliS
MSVAPQAYLKTKVLTASPAELRLLLLDGALRFAEQTRSGYEARELEKALEGTTKCQAILTELMCSLRPNHNPQLCEKLSALYTYMYKRMVEASMSKSAEIVQEVIGLLQYDRETWTLLMKELSTTGAAAASSQSDPARTADGSTTPARFSVSG